MCINKLTAIFLLHFLPSSILTNDEHKYGLLGGEVVLKPESFPPKIDRIIWTHGDDKAAEWESDVFDYYRQFNGAAFLDTEKGSLRITQLSPIFNGSYSVGINDNPPKKVSELIVLGPVSKPSFDFKCDESVCVLTCIGEDTVKGEYAWRKDEGGWTAFNGTLPVPKTEEVNKAYTCKYSNPVSSAVSDPLVPFPNQGGRTKGNGEGPGDRPPSDEHKYGLLGGEVVLEPESFPPKIDRIIWTHGDDKAAEWESDVFDYYRQFNGTTFLDTEKGSMRITQLSPIFNGSYSVGINDNPPKKVSELIVLGPVGKPSFDFKCDESVCVLTCIGEDTVKGEYAWRKSEGGWTTFSGTLPVPKTEEVNKAYTCKYSNPVSSAVSDPIVPFPNQGNPAPIVVGVVVALVLVVALGVVAFKFREIRERVDNLRFSYRGGRTKGNGNVPPSDEAVPLKVPPAAPVGEQDSSANHCASNEAVPPNVLPATAAGTQESSANHCASNEETMPLNAVVTDGDETSHNGQQEPEGSCRRPQTSPDILLSGCID